MKSKKGTTLIEVVIATFVVSVVVVTFLESLGVAIYGTLDVNQRTAAVNTARAELEYSKFQSYNASTGNMSQIYSSINISGPGYTVNGNVSEATVNGVLANISLLQQLTLNVTYLEEKSVSVTGYKAPRHISARQTSGSTLASEAFNVPVLPYGGFLVGAGNYYGYYHVIQTGGYGPISVTWHFQALPALTGNSISVAIYSDTPSWALDHEGVVTLTSLPINSLASSSIDDYTDYFKTIWCITSSRPVGTYTVLFFNGNDDDTVLTYSGSAAFYW